jgi:hypothetical protein
MHTHTYKEQLRLQEMNPTIAAAIVIVIVIVIVVVCNPSREYT